MLRRLVPLVALAATLAAPARGQGCDVSTAQQVIADCDGYWRGDFFLIVSLRGWCYIMGGAACVLF